MKPEKIIEETQREAIINRPHNLAGSVQRVLKERFSITFDKVEYKETNIVPAVIKLFQEALDNPIDVAIKSNFEYANKIDINVTHDTITVSDNGYGISSEKDDQGRFYAFKAFCLYNTSSNYQRDNDGQKGVNGIGVKLCSTLSTYLMAISDDGKLRVKVQAFDNNHTHEITSEKSKKRGTEVTFKPDFRIFEIDTLDEEHINRMYEYTLIQALTYPEITFSFNGKSAKYTNKKFLSLFDKEFVMHESENYFVAIMSNDMDDFKQISYVNGLETQRGGSHIDYVTNGIVGEIREKLIKKYKTIKPGDIKHKLQFVVVARNFKGLKWDGQTKESVTNPNKDMAEFFSDIDFKKLSDKILKTPAIIDPITEVYKIKEELKKRQEMSGLEKTKKKVKSEKYLPAIGQKKYIVVAEGDSATSALIPVLGRNNFGYFSLKGKPLNAYSAEYDKFAKNTELTDLYKIAKNEGYEYILIASDSDSDGAHIRYLLLGFVHKYLPERKDQIRILLTPIMATKKNNKMVNWVYNFGETLKVNSGETQKYYKGLGSFLAEDLKQVIDKDGLDNMIKAVDFDSEEILDDWLSNSKSDKRKEYILANDFDITKV